MHPRLAVTFLFLWDADLSYHSSKTKILLRASVMLIKEVLNYKLSTAIKI